MGVLGVFLLAAMFPEKMMIVAGFFVNRFLPKRYREMILGFADKFLDGLQSLRSPKEALMVFAHLRSNLAAGDRQILVRDARLSLPGQFFTLMLMNGIVNLATTIPSAPGYVGTFDAPGIAVLAAYGVTPALAAGYTLVLHVALWLPITPWAPITWPAKASSWNEELRKCRAEGMSMKIAIIGAGIGGMAAAYDLVAAAGTR